MSTNGKTLKFRAAKLKGFTVFIQLARFRQRRSNSIKILKIRKKY